MWSWDVQIKRFESVVDSPNSALAGESYLGTSIPPKTRLKDRRGGRRHIILTVIILTVKVNEIYPDTSSRTCTAALSWGPHRTLHTTLLTAHWTLYTTHCTLHTTLHTCNLSHLFGRAMKKYVSLLNKHFTGLTESVKMPYREVHTEHCTLQCTLHTTLHTAHYTAHCTLHTVHC